MKKNKEDQTVKLGKGVSMEIHLGKGRVAWIHRDCNNEVHVEAINNGGQVVAHLGETIKSFPKKGRAKSFQTKGY